MRLRNHLRSYTDLGRQTLNCSANDAYNHQTLQNVQTKKLCIQEQMGELLNFKKQTKICQCMDKPGEIMCEVIMFTVP